MVGVLPGTDTDPGAALVLVCAHYDHVGKDGKGRVCPGAADNAAGVAALLETARRLGAGGQQLKRSILFVAFDCEELMLLGSFAFTCQKDVQQARIAAVVNLDILGRDFLDVVEQTMLVAGTERYPELRHCIGEFGAEAGLRVIPVGTDLIGPRSDHVAFESRAIPCLFFTSGMYGDYHKYTDVPGKLNYGTLERSARVVVQTVRELANGESRQASASLESSYADELRSVAEVMAEVVKNADRAGIEEGDAQAFRTVADEAQRLVSSGRYDRAARERLILMASGALVPYLVPVEEMPRSTDKAERRRIQLTMQWLQQFYLRYRGEMLEGYHQLVAQLLHYRPGVFRRMPDFKHELFEIEPEDIRFSEICSGRYALNALASQWTLTAGFYKSKPFLPKTFGVAMAGSVVGIDCEGTPEQIEGFCLLKLCANTTNALQTARLLRVLAAVTGTNQAKAYPILVQGRLERGGFTNEASWIASCLTSDVPELVVQAIAAGGALQEAKVRERLRYILLDRSVRADVRAAAIRTMGKGRDDLLALCEVLDDSSPVWTAADLPWMRKGYPFLDRVAVQAMAAMAEKIDPASYKQTIGALAREQLKGASGKDFGNDPARWGKWIRAHVAG
jgi:hypothetical protein